MAYPSGDIRPLRAGAGSLDLSVDSLVPDDPFAVLPCVYNNADM